MVTGLPDFPQVLPANTIVGNIRSTASAAEALPIASLFSAASLTPSPFICTVLTAQTSVVTPLVQTTSALNIQFGVNGVAYWQVDQSQSPIGSWLPTTDNVSNIGAANVRIKSVFTPIIDSGTAASLFLKTNNGTTQLELTHTVGANHIQITSGTSPILSTTAGNLSLFTAGTTIGLVIATGSLDSLLVTPASPPKITSVGNTGVQIGDASNDVKWGHPDVALGGGAAPTLGTIGGSGPATAGQRNWLRFVESDGTVSFIPVWR